MWCQDPFLSALKAFGYSVVRLPRPDLAPLHLLARLGRDLEELGRLQVVLPPGRHVPVPTVVIGRPCPALSGQRSASLDAGLGLSLLASIVSSLGGSPQVVRLLGRRARRVTFEFGEVEEDGVALAELDQYLADAHVNARARHVARLLESDDLYVTTSIVKSRSFAVSATDEGGVELEFDVPAVGALAGAEVKVSGAAVGATTLRFEGQQPLGFGFRALRLFYDSGRYTAFKPLRPGQLALARDAANPEWYQCDGAFARVTVSETG
ncbi:MAG TPA: hypothetical protein VK911_11320 [Vicinamibacterales bacterium]|nr:hypothetical protein [Vicinamibacterales bacterium]